MNPINEKLDKIDMVTSILSGGLEYFLLSFRNIGADEPMVNDMVYILNDFAKNVSEQVTKTSLEITNDIGQIEKNKEEIIDVYRNGLKSALKSN